MNVSALSKASKLSSEADDVDDGRSRVTLAMMTVMLSNGEEFPGARCSTPTLHSCPMPIAASFNPPSPRSGSTYTFCDVVYKRFKPNAVPSFLRDVGL